MKAKDPTRLSALRMLKAALMNKGVEKNRALDGAEELQVVSTLVKQRRDSIEQFTNGGRRSGRQGTAEIGVLESLSAAGGQPRGAASGGDAGDRRDRRHRPKGHGQGDEGRHGRAGRQDRRRQERQRARQGQAGLIHPLVTASHIFWQTGRQTFGGVLDRLYL